MVIIKDFARHLKLATKLMFKDKILFLLSSFPTLIGSAIYLLMGRWGYFELRRRGDYWIQNYFSSEGTQTFFGWVMVLIFAVFFFFLIGWTFVTLVSLIAAPFHDAISGRVEGLLGGKTPKDLSTTFKDLLKKSFFTLKTEAIKIFFILGLGLFSFLLGLIPLLTPVALVLCWILLSIQFLDYNWSRHDWRVRTCLGDLRKNIGVYTLSGGGLMLILGIPILNLVGLPLGVIYFTILWHHRNMKQIETAP